MKDKYIIIAIIIAIAVLGVGYMNYQTKQNVLKEQRDAEMRQLQKYVACVTDANNNYNSDWNAQCEVQGLDKRTAGCSLPRFIAQDVETRKEKALKNCVDMFK